MKIVQINFRIILLLLGLISHKIGNIVATTKEDEYGPLLVKGSEQVTEENHALALVVPYSASNLKYKMQKKHDDLEALRSNIKDSSSKIDKYFESINTTPQTMDILEETKSLSSYRSQDNSDQKHFEENQPQSIQGLQHFTMPKNAIEQDQQKIYSIKLPNQHFHNQAMQLNADYQGYITHDSPSFVQHPNRHLSQATKMHFGSSIPSNFEAHFEALTQNKEKPKEYSIREVHHHNTPSQIKALSGNYYNTNVQYYDNQQNHHEPQTYIQDNNNPSPHFEALQRTQYGSNVHHNEQSYNHNPNNDKSVQYGTAVTHYDTPQYPASNSYFHDENNHMPRFEALNGNYPQNNHPENNYPSTNVHIDNGYKRHKTYFNNESESKILKDNGQTIPNQAVLLNHKIYHDDNYQKSDNNKYNSNRPKNVHQTYRADILKPSSQVFAEFNQHIDGNGNQNNKSKKQQKRSRHHRKHGHSHNRDGYSTIEMEHPQETKISQKNILPLIPKPEKANEKFYINVEDESINRNRLNGGSSNKTRVISTNLKSRIPLVKEKNKTSDNDKESHEEYNNDFKENKDREVVKPVHEDFDEKDASPKEITNEIRYFQDIYLAHKSPHETEFGHVLETPEKVEERFESNDRKNHRYKGKIQWTNKDGEYGQQFWDLGHLEGK